MCSKSYDIKSYDIMAQLTPAKMPTMNLQNMNHKKLFVNFVIMLKIDKK